MLTLEQLLNYVDNRLTLHNLIFTLSAIVVTYCSLNIAIAMSIVFIVVELSSRYLINKGVIENWRKNKCHLTVA